MISSPTTLDRPHEEDTANIPLRQVLLVDDHPLFRRGIRAILEGSERYKVCAEAENLPKALQAMRSGEPDAAIVDISLPGQNGIEVIKALLAERPRLPVLVVSMHRESVYAFRALRAGALGYMRKSAVARHLLEGLENILEGKLHVSPEFREEVIFKVVQSRQLGQGSIVDDLSERELEVLELIGCGRNTRDIAAKLGVSVKTIETHRARIREKLRMRDGGEFVRFAVDWVNCERF